ncbi:hypothetical protein LZ906_007850 [Paraclostridium ghonii]|uniref:hypothetical protein n=1 Tax=Paraclostridium ghonii TaxID=29358 RepID=UPI00202D055E|nr:hypothetical protein [Paeniclostridium ghonii]MCM0165660.1 hypothetical protein [Paeniclostridium ghonii]
MNQEFIPTTDVVMVTLDGYQIKTADEYEAEPEVQEGDKQDLIIKGELIANKETPTIIKGYNLKFKDNGIRPELMKKLQGGAYTPGTESKGFNYKGPTVGALKPVKIEEICVYTEVVGVGGSTGEYIKVTYSNCIGDLVKFGFKDGEYYSSEFTVKSRPTTGMETYTMDLVTELPVESL